MDKILLDLVLKNPQLLQAIIQPIIEAIVKEASDHPDFLAKFVESIVKLFAPDNK